MKAVIFFIGILTIKFSQGKPNGFSVEDEVHKVAQSLVKPFLDKTKEADETLANVWKAYNEKKLLLNNKILNFKNGNVGADNPTTAAPGVTTTTETPTTADPDSCLSLRESMAVAQGISNEAAALGVQVMGDLSDILLTTQDCITFNVFRAASCSAHKLKDVRDLYNLYKPKLNEVESRLSEALKKVGKEFVGCFHRVNN